MAEAPVYFTKETKGKKAGMAKEDFGRYVPISFEITSVEDQAAAVSHVNVKLIFMNHSNSKTGFSSCNLPGSSKQSDGEE